MAVWKVLLVGVDQISILSEAADNYLRGNTRLGIPAFQIAECLHGQFAFGATIFPQAIAQGSTWNSDLIQRMAGIIAEEASLSGVDQALSPLFDLARDPRYGRVEECYGEDPFHVAKMGIAFVTGMQGDPSITKDSIPENKLVCTAKHFVAYSTPLAGINLGPVIVGPRDLRGLHFYPFNKVVEEANVGLLGALHGHPTINACIEDQTFKTYLRAFLDQEATPILGNIEGIDLEDYKDSLLERFANPNIKDSVSRICSESSAKLPKFLIATIHDNLATGGSIKFATLVIAAWCYYSDKGMDRHGHPIEIIDAMSTELHQAAKQTTTDPLAFIRQESLFGNLVKNERFTKLYTEAVQKIYKDTNIKKYMIFKEL